MEGVLCDIAEYHWRLGVVVKHHMKGLMYVPMHGICNHNGPLPLAPAFTAPAGDATAGNAQAKGT